MQIAILFGYMTLFVAALPGSTIVVWIALWCEIKTDSWKILHETRRPWPFGAQDIGTFQDIFDLVSTASVITNAAMIVFTMNMVKDYSQYTQFWIFIGFQWVIFSLQFLIRFVIADTPFEVTLQKRRAEYLNRKLILCEYDDDDSLNLGDLEAKVEEDLKSIEYQNQINNLINDNVFAAAASGRSGYGGNSVRVTDANDIEYVVPPNENSNFSNSNEMRQRTVSVVQGSSNL